MLVNIFKSRQQIKTRMVCLTKRSFLFGSQNDSKDAKESQGMFSFLTGEQEPIVYETTKELPYSQQNFYEVIRNVNDYQNFVPYMTRSEIFEKTHKKYMKNGVHQGKFDAET